MVPSARVGHLGMYRNEETMEPVQYFCKMPRDVAERDVLIVDPMLATGGSADAAIQIMKGYSRKSLVEVSLSRRMVSLWDRRGWFTTCTFPPVINGEGLGRGLPPQPGRQLLHLLGGAGGSQDGTVCWVSRRYVRKIRQALEA